MRHFWLFALFLTACLFGCGAAQDGSSNTGNLDSSSGSVLSSKANVFNPYVNSSLPNTRQLSADGAKMLPELGGKAQSIEGEARHRKNWREELYPVVFGERNAPHEIMVVLNFSSPASEEVWKAVVAASKSLQPTQCKIVVFGKSDENYGIDLMGMAIWLAQARKGQAMPWLTYALSRWNAVKAAQKSAGQVRSFKNEYDAVVNPQDYPIQYAFLARLQPPVPADQELAVAKYCYNAGNVNMYQATQVCQYYGVSKLPAVIVDGKNLGGKISSEAILAALK